MKFYCIIFMLQLSANYPWEFLKDLLKIKAYSICKKFFLIYGVGLKFWISLTATEYSYSLKFPLSFQTARGDTISKPSFSLELDCWWYRV